MRTFKFRHEVVEGKNEVELIYTHPWGIFFLELGYNKFYVFENFDDYFLLKKFIHRFNTYRCKLITKDDPRGRLVGVPALLEFVSVPQLFKYLQRVDSCLSDVCVIKNRRGFTLKFYAR